MGRGIERVPAGASGGCYEPFPVGLRLNKWGGNWHARTDIRRSISLVSFHRGCGRRAKPGYQRKTIRVSTSLNAGCEWMSLLEAAQIDASEVLKRRRDWYGNGVCWHDRCTNLRTVPGLETCMEPMHPVCFKTSDGQRYLIDWRDIEIAMERDPEGRTIPSGNPNELLLTAGD